MKNTKLYGVGINDSKEPVTRKVKGKVVWRCPYFKKWSKMLKRCYSKESLEENPSYANCTVCEDWLTFSVFKVWMEHQLWYLEDEGIMLLLLLLYDF